MKISKYYLIAGNSNSNSIASKCGCAFVSPSRSLGQREKKEKHGRGRKAEGSDSGGKHRWGINRTRAHCGRLGRRRSWKNHRTANRNSHRSWPRTRLSLSNNHWVMAFTTSPPPPLHPTTYHWSGPTLLSYALQISVPSPSSCFLSLFSSFLLAFVYVYCVIHGLWTKTASLYSSPFSWN